MTIRDPQVSLLKKIEIFESLVEEILKDFPAESTVKQKMELLDIPYSIDPIERINRILTKLEPFSELEFEE